ncbi:hypothetical protein, partial [Mycobacterium intermedium]|uniref:hypothetical protein n=1 Tax=Mycobacterium intermedium TaxID=28445 RepID=UPI0021F38B1C
NPARSLAHHPLFQVMLAWQNWQGKDTDTALVLGQASVTPVAVQTHTARMDLSLSLAERWGSGGEPAGIAGTVEFRTDVFDAASIEAAAGVSRRGSPARWSSAPMCSMRPASRRCCNAGSGYWRRWSPTQGSGCRRSMCWMRPNGPGSMS